MTKSFYTESLSVNSDNDVLFNTSDLIETSSSVDGDDDVLCNTSDLTDNEEFRRRDIVVR